MGCALTRVDPRKLFPVDLLAHRVRRAGGKAEKARIAVGIFTAALISSSRPVPLLRFGAPSLTNGASCG